MRVDKNEIIARFLRAVEAFVSQLSTCQDGPIYALVVYVDSFDSDFGAYANTESEYEKSSSEYGENTLASHMELKFNGADMKYSSFSSRHPELSEPFEQLSSISEQIHELAYQEENDTSEQECLAVEEAACEVACMIEESPSLGKLSKTEDFAILVSGHDEYAIAGFERIEHYKRHKTLAGSDAYAHKDIRTDSGWERRMAKGPGGS